MKTTSKWILVLALCLGAAWVLGARTAGAAGPPAINVHPIIDRLGARHIAATTPEARASFEHYRRLTETLRRRGAKATNPVFITTTFVDFDANTAVGTVDTLTTLTIKAREDGVTQAEFLMSKLATFAVTDGADNPLTFDYDALYQTLTVDLGATLNTDDTMALKFHNAGLPNCAPDDLFGMEFCHVGDDVIYFAFVDFVPTIAAYTEAELYGGGPMDIDVHTPPDWTAATTSDPDGVDESVGEWIHHFTGHFGTTYLGLAAADFATFTAVTTNGETVTAYIHSGTTDFGQHWADTGADILNTYSDWFSDYLYNKHDLIQTRDELGGGVGPQSATFYYASALNTDPAGFTAESIYSHEIGHQWWANMVRLGDNYSPWLNEGFAEYSSRLYGYNVWPEYYQDYLYDLYFYYFLFAVGPDNEVPMSGPGVFAGDSMAYQAATYWKGSHVLRMLEWWLGHDEMLEALKTYAEAYRSDASDEVVNADDFQAVVESVTGADLDEFMSQWTQGTGYPIYRFAAEFDGNSARVRVTQEQTGTVFSLPVPVSIWVGDEDDPREERMEFDASGVADQTFDYGAEPRGVKVDQRSFIWGDKVAALEGDVDGSNEVDGLDLVYLGWSDGGSALGTSGSWNYITECDSNRDGVVDDTDISAALANFGKEGRIND